MPLALALPVQPVSALILADRLISLAQDADLAGYRDTAKGLLSLVEGVLGNGGRR